MDAEAMKQQKKTYIIHMDKSYMPADFDDHVSWYGSSLKSISESANVLYSYNNVIHGYSTKLAAEEAEILQNQPGVIYVQEDVILNLHTTRTPDFLRLDQIEEAFPLSNTMSEVIIGVLDTGVWPEVKSFKDNEIGSIPSSWKGACETGKTFNSSSCNRKLIGARAFYQGYEAAFGTIDETIESKSPRDDDGHGTHTASTAAGTAVAGASLLGYAAGTARGMARRARLAMYKVCWAGGCFGSDILAGIEKAVQDGVHILSLSLGGSQNDYFRDIIAIGSFTAMSHGILVSCSAGNAGPDIGTLSNVAPWITTVGAGTIDRDFPAYITLGNGKVFSGASLYHGKQSVNSFVPLVYAGNATNVTNGNLCTTGSLISQKVAGKVVVCDRGLNARAQKGLVVKNAGGVGMILSNTATYGEELVADAHLLPAAAVGQNSGDLLKKYIFSEAKPTAMISFKGTKVGVQPSPVIAAFSSRGPNTITPEILKPDVIAPGVNILAGWTGKVGPTGLQEDPRHVSFNIISGTSMSCPHISGLAALVKAAHPDWSPAAVRSALMTTAYSTYKNGNSILDAATKTSATPFDYGSGHVNPLSALAPGLVYDIVEDDYIDFLCALNYTSSLIKVITKKDVTCNEAKKYSVKDLNYPSFAVPFETASGTGGGDKAPKVAKYTRTLTNVGNPATYKISIISYSQDVKIMVQPETLTFSNTSEKKMYTVTFSAISKPSGTVAFARIEWSDGISIVGSPIAFSWT
ncbi:hypothetical protein Leryth_017155 [Lithospermum erythrorhizon]|nr:hypothetical protein Leryth_017155 [Lithospermum erythrorhizon]